MKVMVVGSGSLGRGIAQVLITNGSEVILKDTSEEKIEAGVMAIVRNLEEKVVKGTMKEAEKNIVLKRISATTDIKNASECDLIIEAIDDNMRLKKELFKQLDHICSRDTIFATNTSNLSITEMASSITRPDKLIGMRFFTPALTMNHIEVTDTEYTSERTHHTVLTLINQIQKIPVTIKEVLK